MHRNTLQYFQVGQVPLLPMPAGALDVDDDDNDMMIKIKPKLFLICVTMVPGGQIVFLVFKTSNIRVVSEWQDKFGFVLPSPPG